MKKFIIYLLIITAAISCQKDERTSYVWDPPPKPVDTTPVAANFSYRPFGPGAIVENGYLYLYYTDQPDDENYSGAIHFRKIKMADQTVEVEVKNILEKGTAGEWDNAYVGDPCVVSGTNIVYEGKTYNTVMFYTGANQDYEYNQVGIALSNSFEATTWVKYKQPLITKTWSGTGNLNIGGRNRLGSLQPAASTVGNGGEFLLAYTVDDETGLRVIRRHINIGNLSAINLGNSANSVSIAGLFQLDGDAPDFLESIDYAWDYTGVDQFFMVRPVHSGSSPGQITEKIEIMKMPGAGFWSDGGAWTKVGEIGIAQTGKKYNHTPAIGKVAWGGIAPDFGINVIHYVSDSLETPSGNHYYNQWNYELKTSVINL
ncbi:hypothetical protein [Gynurincola endophyticus]|uniref:hypothetical protein n=1 Tax=Gynurincola endophyticus TaxID=2479004 RepID=UPI000F8D173F|nr:hypothetical protein [Gynurincola endophyticus]